MQYLNGKTKGWMKPFAGSHLSYQRLFTKEENQTLAHVCPCADQRVCSHLQISLNIACHPQSHMSQQLYSPISADHDCVCYMCYCSYN